LADPFYGTAEWKALRTKVRRAWIASGRPCFYCGKPFAPGEWMVVDHIQNRRQFPRLALVQSNLGCVHKECNTKKAAYFENNKREEIGFDGFPPGW
jgi:5-methylcytosine-specific restriction endonuclease McrA